MGAALQLGELRVELVRKDIKNVHLSVHPPGGRNQKRARGSRLTQTETCFTDGEKLRTPLRPMPAELFDEAGASPPKRNHDDALHERDVAGHALGRSFLDVVLRQGSSI
jgi:hypothetical protein